MKHKVNKHPKQEELPNYQKHYSESKLWKKLKRVARRLGGNSTYHILMLYYVMQSPHVALKNKATIIGALGYFILPFDLIMDVFPVLGFTDDVAAILLTFKAVQASVTPEIEFKAKSKLDEWFG